MPFQDTYLGKTPLGFLGSSISFLPLTLYVLIDFYIWLERPRLIAPRTGMIWCLYALILSLVYILIWGPVSHGESVIYKTFSMSIVSFLWAYTVFGIDFTPTTGLRYSTYLAFGLVILGVLICDLQLLGGSIGSTGSFVHITSTEGGGRWRSFSPEPSIFSATAVGLGLVSAHLSRKPLSRVFFVVVTLGLLVFSQSKGGFLVLGLSGFIILFLRKPSPLRAAIYLVFCTVFLVSMLYVISLQIGAVDLYTATGTIATRCSLLVWTLIVLVHHPLGVGLSGFYQAITIYLPEAMDFVRKVSPIQLDFSEVSEYVYGGNLPIDAKCFFLEYLASFGIPFLIAYVGFARKVFNALIQRNQNLLLIAVVFLFLGLTTYVNGFVTYVVFYVMGLGYREYRIWNSGRRQMYSATVASLNQPSENI